MSGQNRWHPMAKLMIGGRDKFMGPGCRELLELIQETGSVRIACDRMGLSYSKAWNILNTLEREAGFPVLLRRRGGAGGGETQLTPSGKELLARYIAFEQECQGAIAAIFEHHFPMETKEL